MASKHFSRIRFKIRWYKYIHGKLSKLSEPIICDKDGSFEIHLLTCEKDYYDALYCLKSFCIMSNLCPPIVIHDDGSLSRKSFRKFQKHFKGCKIINRNDADKEILQYLSSYKYTKKYRYENFMHHSIKLIDCLYYSRCDGTVIMDSDLLFFRKPTALLDNIRNNKGCFTSDYQNSYALPIELLRKLTGCDVREKINTGLVYIPSKKEYNKKLIEDFLEIVYKKGYPNKSFTEQTAFSILFSENKDCFSRLGPEYQISHEPLSNRTVSHHFVGDGSRNDFYMKGLPFLLKKMRRL